MEPAPPTAPAGIDRTEIQAGPSRGGYIPPADDDLDLLAESNRRMGKVTIALMAAVLAGLAFIGGVVVQKQFGNSSAGAPGGGMSAMGGNRSADTPERRCARGLRRWWWLRRRWHARPGQWYRPGWQRCPERNRQYAGGCRNRDQDLRHHDRGEELLGQECHGESTSGTTVSSSTDSALTGLSKGDSVSVAGTTADDGVVTATSITAS